VLVLIVWAVAVGIALLVLAILGYGLLGQFRRLLRAVEDTSADLAPKAATLRADTRGGRHRAR